MKSFKFSKKYLTILMIFCIVFLVIFFIKNKYQKKIVKENILTNDQVNQTKENPIFQNPSWRAQTELISPRNAQIENYLNFPEKFPSELFGGRLLYLVVYPNSDGSKIQNFEGRYGRRPGIVIFEGKKKIWENKENLAEIYQDSVQFKDVTGDGVPEIVVIDRGGGNEDSCGTNVYKWNNNTFELITPPDTEDGINPCEGSDATKGGFKDIDNDGVMELISFRWDKAYPKITDNNDPLFYATKEIELIYKFNGTKYVLSKKIPTGVIRNN
jgi:hypothetical protein